MRYVVSAVVLALGVAGCGKPSSPAEDRKGRKERAAATTDEGGDETGAKAKYKAKAKDKNQKKHTCNICGSTTKFNKVRATGRPDAQCSVCKSMERHRLLVHYLENGTDLFHQKLKVLHFSPQEAEETVFRHQPNWEYVTTDYEHTEDLGLDLTNIAQPDDSWDLVIVYHIFEHIIEDQKGMKELYRIVRPGGKAIVQVPLELDQKETYEDATITSPKERKKHFGQSNHVRKYSIQGFRERLEAVGFQVEAVDYVKQLDPAFVAKHRMSAAFDPPQDESIWVCTKPAPPGVEPAIKPYAAAPEAKPTPAAPATPAAPTTPEAKPAPAAPTTPEAKPATTPSPAAPATSKG